MNRNLRRYGLIIVVIMAFISCQKQEEKKPVADTSVKDSVSHQHPTPSESGYAAVNGLKMYYEVYGNGMPIVLLHGSFMNIPLNWAHIIPLLAANRKVIVTELQAHGRTRDIAREFSYEAMADDVSGLLKHLKLDSADILGYSMGGGVAFQFAVRHPEQLRRLVILSGSYAHNGWWPEVEKTFTTINADMFMGSPYTKAI